MINKSTNSSWLSRKNHDSQQTNGMFSSCGRSQFHLSCFFQLWFSYWLNSCALSITINVLFMSAFERLATQQKNDLINSERNQRNKDTIRINVKINNEQNWKINSEITLRQKLRNPTWASSLHRRGDSQHKSCPLWPWNNSNRVFEENRSNFTRFSNQFIVKQHPIQKS